MITINGKKVEVVEFSDGDLLVKTDSLVFQEVINIVHPSSVTTFHVRCIIEDCARDITLLGLVKNTLDRMTECTKKEIILSIPYFPAARSDRVFGAYEGFNVKYYAKLINDMNFDKVFVEDAHSDVTPALLNNVRNSKQYTCLSNDLKNIKDKNTVIVAPDLGATKKIEELCKFYKKPDYLQCVKIRNVMTGEIIKCDVVTPNGKDPKKLIEGKTMLIVDDICDGGGTFIHLAKMLRNYGADKVYLSVTHGIFAKGLIPFLGLIDKIYVTNLIGGYVERNHIDQYNSEEA